MTPVEKKLQAARTALILNHPFIGALALYLPLIESSANGCITAATDARYVYYNAKYMAGLSFDETQFLLAHETMHCALCHFSRRLHRDVKRWNLACDYAINQLLIKDGLTPPPGTLISERYAGMSAEEIYPFIPHNCAESTLDIHLYGPVLPANDSISNEHDNSIPPATAAEPQSAVNGLPPDAQRQLERLWQQRVMAAMHQSLRSGQMNTSFHRYLQGSGAAQVPWRQVLTRYLATTTRGDYSFLRQSRRRQSEILLPGFHAKALNLIAVVDSSGSIEQTELNQFVDEINAVKSYFDARITLHACDNQLCNFGPWTFEAWENMCMPDFIFGGGATSFVPVFEWLERQDMAPDVLLYFTDAKGIFPETCPVYPVVWLIKGEGAVPWGHRIQLN